MTKVSGTMVKNKVPIPTVVHGQQAKRSVWFRANPVVALSQAEQCRKTGLQMASESVRGRVGQGSSCKRQGRRGEDAGLDNSRG